MDESSQRRSRRAVRPAGTVGTDESVLRSAVPAVQPATGATTPAPSTAAPTDRRTDALLALRSADDSDVGWGERGDDADADLRANKPPHW